MIEGSKELKPVGEWNHARIVARGPRCEHWLNGRKVVEYEIGSEEFQAGIAGSKFKDVEGFAETLTGRIFLQDHNDEVWYRNIRIRELGD